MTTLIQMYGRGGKNAEASKMGNVYWVVGMCDVFGIQSRVGHGGRYGTESAAGDH